MYKLISPGASAVRQHFCYTMLTWSMCSVHAASVLQLTHMVLCHGGIPHAVMPAATRLTTYWTALVHDFEHGGLNNDFLIKTGSPLAILYNDQSPLENHHCSAACRQFIHPDHFYIAVGTAVFCLSNIPPYRFWRLPFLCVWQSNWGMNSLSYQQAPLCVRHSRR